MDDDGAGLRAWDEGAWSVTSTAATALAFAPLSGTAALMLVPYLAWVCVAFALNLSVWRLNRHGGVFA